jgi:hypothetical protein
MSTTQLAALVLRIARVASRRREVARGTPPALSRLMRAAKHRTITSFEDAILLLMCWMVVVWLIIRA